MLGSNCRKEEIDGLTYPRDLHQKISNYNSFVLVLEIFPLYNIDTKSLVSNSIQKL